MAIIKGFVSAPLLTNNQSGVFSNIGELSNQHHTYAKDKRIYSLEDIDTDTIAFSIKEQNGAASSITDTLGQNIARVGDYVVEHGINNLGPYVENQLVSDLNDDFLTLFDGFVLGPSANEGSVYVPSFITFKTPNNEHTIKLWFSGEAFGAQYDEYEIYVISRLSNLSDYNVVDLVSLQTNLDAEPESSMITRMTDIINQSPPTQVVPNYVTWVSRVDPTDTAEILFTFVVYGNGYDLETLKEETINLLLDFTNGDDSQWRLIFPSLFGSNKYFIVPHWDKITNSNATPRSSLYSPITADGDGLSYAQIAFGNQNTSHISSTAETVSSTYKGLLFTIYPAEDNVSGIIEFSRAYPSFTAMTTSSPSFNTLNAAVRDLLLTLEDLFLSAEVMGEGSSLENGVSRRVIDNKTYAVASTDNGNTFYMLSRTDVVG